LQACLDNCTDCSKFDDVWHLLGEKFTLLIDFAGGLASVFSRSATVESFSLPKLEKNKFRSALLADISLGGILHYRQYEGVLNQKTEYSRMAICTRHGQPRRKAPKACVSFPEGSFVLT
jgi:hypothetical protein